MLCCCMVSSSHCADSEYSLIHVLVLVQLLEALDGLHSANVLHRDLKAANLLLKDGELRVADFGVGKEVLHLADIADTCNIGTPGYQALEVLETRAKQNIGVDIWAAGLIYWQMLLGRHPWPQVGDQGSWRVFKGMCESSID